MFLIGAGFTKLFPKLLLKQLARWVH